MLHGVLAGLISDRSALVEREKGIAFLSAVRSIYQLENCYYFCANIGRNSNKSFVHCAFSDAFASQATTPNALPSDRLAELEIIALAGRHNRAAASCRQLGGTSAGADGKETTAFFLTSRAHETAVLAITRNAEGNDEEGEGGHPTRELKVLGDYFHSHMLRRHGYDTSEALVVSGRELDCLRWVAAGKSAWEASVILGITERTVRFHLNSAREKLNCATTTQAVAKVVAQQLISV